MGLLSTRVFKLSVLRKLKRIFHIFLLVISRKAMVSTISLLTLPGGQSVMQSQWGPFRGGVLEKLALFAVWAVGGWQATAESAKAGTKSKISTPSFCRQFYCLRHDNW